MGLKLTVPPTDYVIKIFLAAHIVKQHKRKKTINVPIVYGTISPNFLRFE